MVNLYKLMRDGGMRGTKWGHAMAEIMDDGSKYDLRVDLYPEDIALLRQLGVDDDVIDKAPTMRLDDEPNRGYTMLKNMIDVVLDAVKTGRIDVDATREWHHMHPRRSHDVTSGKK